MECFSLCRLIYCSMKIFPTSLFLFVRVQRLSSLSAGHNQNNPVMLDNSDPKPYTIDTWKQVFTYRPANIFRLPFNLFYDTY